jgi:hypothetical protein
MFLNYFAKPWLEVSVGYVAGRLVDFYDTDKLEDRIEMNPALASDGGYAECLACPELGVKEFRRRHTLARFLRAHRNCGKRCGRASVVGIGYALQKHSGE